jgi:hypothetical protein
VHVGKPLRRDVMFTRDRKVMSRTYLLDGIVAAKALDSRR